MPRSGKRPPKPVPVPVPSVAATANSNPGPPPTTTVTTTAGSLKRRKPGPAVVSGGSAGSSEARARGGEERKGGIGAGEGVEMAWTTRNQWVVYAVASGACAAFNGVFAKLTTNDLTGHIARGISEFFGFEAIDKILEITVRCIFFGLNLFFNGVMWTLFTQALAKGHSTTQVSIMNTSTNFMLTALLGLAIFAESLPPLWWAGAALLVTGNVVIGRRDGGVVDDHDAGSGSGSGAEPRRSGEEGEGRGRQGDDDGDDDDGNGGDDDDDDAAERGRLRVLVPELADDEDVPLIGDLDRPSDDGRRG